jgi:hypothetical protein
MVDESLIPPAARPDTTGQPPVRGTTPEDISAMRKEQEEKVKNAILARKINERLKIYNKKVQDIEAETPTDEEGEQAPRSESSWRKKIKNALIAEKERIKLGPRNYDSFRRFEKMSPSKKAKTVLTHVGKGVHRGLYNTGFSMLGGKTETSTETGYRSKFVYAQVEDLDELGKRINEGWEVVRDASSPGRWVIRRQTGEPVPYTKVTKTLIEPGLFSGNKTVRNKEFRPDSLSHQVIYSDESTTTETPGVVYMRPSPKGLAAASNFRPVAREIQATKSLLPRKYVSPYAALAQGGTPIPVGYHAVTPPVFRLPPRPPSAKFGNGDVYASWGKFIDMSDMMGTDVLRYEMQSAAGRRFGMLGKPVAMLGPIVSFNNFGMIPGRGSGNLNWVFSMPRQPRPRPAAPRFRPRQTISLPNRAFRPAFNVRPMQSVNKRQNYSNMRYQSGIRWF